MKSAYQELARQNPVTRASITTATEARQMTVIKMFQAMFNASPGADLLNLVQRMATGWMRESALANLPSDEPA